MLHVVCQIRVGRLAQTQIVYDLLFLFHILPRIQFQPAEAFSNISGTQLGLDIKIEQASEYRKNQDQKHPGHIECRITSLVDNIYNNHGAQNIHGAVYIYNIIS